MPRTSESVRDYLTHLAVRQRVSASTQNQALCALLFLCREVIGLNVEGLAQTAKAKRGTHLPVVLSIPETAALLEAMHGGTWLMAALIYGGGYTLSTDPRAGVVRRHPLSDSVIQKAVKAAALKAKIHKPVSSRHTCYSTAWISGRSRSTWDTRTSRRR